MGFFILENVKTNIIYVFLDNEYYYCKLSIYLVLEPSNTNLNSFYCLSTFTTNCCCRPNDQYFYKGPNIIEKLQLGSIIKFIIYSQ